MTLNSYTCLLSALAAYLSLHFKIIEYSVVKDKLIRRHRWHVYLSRDVSGWPHKCLLHQIQAQGSNVQS